MRMIFDNLPKGAGPRDAENGRAALWPRGMGHSQSNPRERRRVASGE